MCETVGHPVRRLVRTASGRSRTGRCGQGSSGSSPRPRCARSGSPPPVGELATRGPFGRPVGPAVAFPLDAPQASVRALRGATTVDEDTPAQIAERVQELLRAVMSANDLLEDDVISILFTATADVTFDLPRHRGTGDRLRRGPLLCAAEIAVPGATPLCLRVLLHVETTLGRDELRHVYLHGAKGFRDDLPAEPGGPTAHGRLPPTWPVRAAPAHWWWHRADRGSSGWPCANAAGT